MNDLAEKVTILIVTFKSQHIIERCIENIGEEFKILIIENSDDKKLTEELENKYSNIECINIGYDSGFGYALNRGIEKIKTKYFISINPDSFPAKDCLIKLIATAENQAEAAMITPVTYVKNNTAEFTAYGYFDKNVKNKNSENILEVDWVNGNVFLMQKKYMQNIGFFDENYFLEYEERDLQRRIYLDKKKILINFNAKSQHLEGKSADQKFSFQMKCEAAWHHSWSKYYYYKKHFGFLHSLGINVPFYFTNLFKYFIFFILNDKKKSKIYRLYCSGFYNSLIKKKSFYRAEID